ncbi:7512_t:CDS:1, partial [Racocetra fulgida]
MPFNSYCIPTQFGLLQFQTNQYSSNALPTMADLLKEIDEKKKTNNFYQNLLNEFELQQISVRHLSKLSDEEFKQCGVNTI